MHCFTKRLNLESGFNPEFAFNKICMINSTYYHVSVNDKAGRNYYFTIEKIKGVWKIVDAPKAPDWIIAVEEILIQALFANQSSK
jgi:hypothetical protein